ncbi:retrovirus-related pol polyprotein from transposon TNT 1-94 [Tanacetum coccineum]
MIQDNQDLTVEIDRLKQTLSEHLKEKEFLMQTVTLLKNDFKKEESRNIDREIALEKKIKQLDNIIFKRDQSAQTVHMLTKPQFFYDHTTKQALGFQNPFYLKKAQQLEPKLYDGNVIKNTSAIVIPDSKETLMLAEESRSKMLLKQKDPMMLEKKVNTTPVDYANSINSLEPTLSSRPTKVEVPKELPKVSMVNTSLKKLKYHLAGFDVVVKERTTPTAITEGSWGFEHTKACFRDEIIPFVKALKDLFNTFDQYLIDELSEVQNVFHQMEQAMEQHRLESKTFEVKMNQVLNENERLLEQVINKDIVNTIMNSSMDITSVNMHECEKCLKLETELLNKKDFIEKEIYDKLDNSVSNQNAPSFDQLFELNELKAQCQEKDTVIKKLKERIKSLSGKMNEDKIKKDLKEIETINIELDHRVSKLNVENKHLKQTYKQLYDSIKPARIRSKEQYDDLINQVNLKFVEISDLNSSLQEKVLVITALKDDLRKLKGKALVDNDVTKHPSNPEMLKIDVEPITPKLLNKKTAHSAYIKHTQEEATALRGLVEHVKSKYPLDQSLESVCRHAKQIQELLTNISKTCLSINNADGKLVAMTPKNNDKRVRFIEPITSSGNTNTKTSSSSNLVSNKPMLSSTGVKPSTSASGSQPSGNTKKDKIQQTPSSTQKNKHSKLNVNSEHKCVKCNGCMLSDNHDLCVLDFINNVNARTKSVKKNLKRKVWKPTRKVFTNIGYIWRPTGQTFTIVGNAFPLTRITTTIEVPLRKPTALDNETSKPVVTLVYSQKLRKSKTNVPVSKSKVLKSISANKKEPNQSWGSIFFDVPSSSLDECKSSKLFSVKFGNDHVAKILGYSDYQIGDVTISRVYYMEGLRHNLFSIGQFCKNMYTLSLGDMMASSPICLLSKALKTKSWLWHRRLSHLNFGAIKYLARHGLVRDNGTEFVNQTLREYYEKVGISHETSVARSPQQNGVIERRNRTLIEAAHTMLIYAKALLFLWAEAVATAFAHMGNDSYFGIPIPEIPSDQSLSSDSIHIIVHPDHQISDHNSKWIWISHFEFIIGELDRLVSTRLQLHEQALFYYYDAFLTVKALYGLKQAPRAWYDMLSSFRISQDFSKGLVDPTLFIRKEGKELLLIFQNPRGIFINQSKYALESLKKYGFDSCDPVDTPMVEKSKLDEDKDGKAVDPSHYRGMIGTLPLSSRQ